jgi:hypothetical protein
MENRKWLQRKYPKIFDEVNEFLNDEQLQQFKKGKYKLGKLTEDINQEEIYGKGKLCIFKRSNPINDYNYPLHPIIVKCNEKLTVSGYNSFWVSPNQVEEV